MTSAETPATANELDGETQLMKPHQVRAQSKRAAQSKQARKTTGKTQKVNPTNGARKRVSVPMQWELAAAVNEAAHAEGCDRETFIRNAISEKIAGVNREEAFEILSGFASKVSNHHDKSAGFHFLVSQHFEMIACSKVQGIEPTGDEACGIMLLGHSIDKEHDALTDEVRRAFDLLGGEKWRKARLAELLAKGGAR